MDAVSDRDYVIEFLSFASMLMMHMSRLSEEICLWSSTEFGFIELDDAFATGSSMMPQKKNPDIAELVRGKTGRVYGHLQAMLVTAKGLPLTYNKDLQEDKEGFFDAVDTIKFSLAVYRDMILTMTVNVDKMQQAVSKDFSNATDLADYLVRKGLPFRQAHEVVGKCVAYAILNNKFLPEITLAEYKEFSDLFEEDLLVALEPYNCVAARKSYGGPAFTENEKQFAIGDEVIAAQEKTLAELQANL
jgi:argininosuccinate lyase